MSDRDWRRGKAAADPSMSKSPRLVWVLERAQELIDLGERYGAMDMYLVGSVARREDHDGSDIDLLVLEFDAGDEPHAKLDARRRADELVTTVREMCPYPVDIRGLPGWLLGEAHELAMRRDAIRLSDLASR